MSPAGDPKQLEVLVKRKAFRTANGDVREILHDFSLTLEAGKIHALVGPSGFGKTTLLRIIIGLDRDFEGSVTLPPGTKIGMVFQEPRLLPWRTVLDNLKLAAPEASETALASLAKDLGLDDHLRNFPGELSLGQARRVALARALAIEPNLLVLDEPFVSLDAALARRLASELAALVERTGVTTLLVTHDIDEAIRLADHIILLGHRPAEIVGNIDVSLPRRAMTADYAAKTKALIGAILAENAV
ncbi:ABC transporter ATP-binding protein [Methylovirgula ligni]|uniref:NitT/TauT family transport system ATP-binding protein n=1 Tax=Methylovirgula ligni TaxID=569860 RepID=A0A3D9YR99_9HYPH|nr:ATP-binding cassette domain-containing protein [Methylovirgula ligni]QAY94970.1 ABC transporter ATP-binding protein [Methylovirgula ligni]REF84578.1 NitT/TauT family transport system ATP-binding protein [Methylovirgula ligni]